MGLHDVATWLDPGGSGIPVFQRILTSLLVGLIAPATASGSPSAYRVGFDAGSGEYRIALVGFAERE